MVKKKNIGIVVFDDDFNHINFVAEVLSQTFGYPMSQAYQCANMIHEKGSYIVKHLDNKVTAETYRNILVSNGITAKIIPV